jgi:hypothetical protein
MDVADNDMFHAQDMLSSKVRIYMKIPGLMNDIPAVHDAGVGSLLGSESAIARRIWAS